VKLEPVTNRKSVRLGDKDARVRGPLKGEDALERDTAKQVERITELQRVFYADARFALLIVLQGRDASGKDGTIRKVFGAVNPQGCVVTSFGVPSEYEQRHDYLWRIHQHVPARRMIGIFNRSHYEDVLIPRVHKSLPKKIWSARYDEINDFERMLSDNGTVILKFMLHISRDEQRERLTERLTDPDKNWKFRAGDLEDRERWDDFTKAYRGILEKTSTVHAPWYIVPADNKDARNYLIARTIAEKMAGLHLRYPKADPSIVGVEVV
jgi:PPK2 family polyphosphate:nucleotide phosphotransferase